ncbi:DarT ssDNA thymidine ADP-ribosyltransferase family protein [Gallibacterium anatis]|uniref:DarT ssDNA thymidine ADP-ribosyltransferase family protein n=1 Tax=Gallibacterium anatis TaxID=750 RepID=UPI00254E9C1B|nr:DarT ssDNA thymidine ADP-ribosyltransferase family protein [Gallibacterium anatis]WIM82851.1 DarT ssDNA thymidine ADP-ribosyltransferase family protein [Gallibacterium anatis]
METFEYHVIRSNIVSIKANNLGLQRLKNPYVTKQVRSYTQIPAPSKDKARHIYTDARPSFSSPSGASLYKNATDLQGAWSINKPTRVRAEVIKSGEPTYFDKQIVDLIRWRKIRWLCHFTRKENVGSIKKHGLLTIDSLNNKGLQRYVSDPHRMDKHKTSICLTISKPNMPMLVSKATQHEYCLILLSPSILYSKKCLFYKTNAATQIANIYDDFPHTGYRAFLGMFEDNTRIDSKNQGIITRGRAGRHLCEPTLEQAEVQCLQDIEPQYILHIIENLSFLYDKWQIDFDKRKPIYEYLEEYINAKH